jgi:hypothetical protein
MLSAVFDWLKSESEMIVKAPLAFVIFLAFGILVGHAFATWYYGRQMALKDEQLSAKDGQLSRYRVALGIDKASDGALIELTHAEMKGKAATTSAKVRELIQSYERRSKHIKTLKLDEKAAGERALALMDEVSREFDRGLRADAINVDNELRRRLGPKAVASIIGLPPTFYSASDGAPLGMMSFVPGGFAAGFLDTLANGIDQMAALLPADH